MAHDPTGLAFALGPNGVDRRKVVPATADNLAARINSDVTMILDAVRERDARIATLEAEVASLRNTLADRDVENMQLYRENRSLKGI